MWGSHSSVLSALFPSHIHTNSLSDSTSSTKKTIQLEPTTNGVVFNDILCYELKAILLPLTPVIQHQKNNKSMMLPKVCGFLSFCRAVGK